MAAGTAEDALIRLMRRYEKEVLKVCTVYLRDLTLAEDATQETFFKAFKAMDRFQGGSSEKTWLMRIAINTCILSHYILKSFYHCSNIHY